MVLAALAFRPKEFAVGVDLFGVSNWLRTLESIPAWWGPTRDSLYKEMGDPAKDDADYLRKISPLFHADKIERPLIVLQGENDPRVLKAESVGDRRRRRKKGVPVEYLVFPNEGHGFARKETQEKAYKATLEFLDKYLKGAARSSEVERYDGGFADGEAACARRGRALRPGKKISRGTWRSSSSRQNPTISSSRSRR